MAHSPTLPELSFESYDGVAPGSVWAGVAAVFQAAFGAAPYFEDPVELEEIVQWGPGRLAGVGGRLAVSRCEERIVGFALVHGLSGDQHWARTLPFLEPADPRVAGMLSSPHNTVVVDELAVDPEYRGRGVAKECLARCIGKRRETRVVLGVFEQAQEARAMYVRWGLENLGTVLVRDGTVTLHVLTAERTRLRLSSRAGDSRPPEPVPVSYVVIRRGDQVLLQLRQGTGYMDGHWATAAAGHVEAGETAVEAALRETREELGIGIAAEDLVPLTTMHRTQAQSPAANKRIDHFFSCDSWSGNPHIMEPDKNAALAWFTLDDLPEALVLHERYVLERLRSGLPAEVSFEVEATATP